MNTIKAAIELKGGGVIMTITWVTGATNPLELLV